MGGEQNKDPSVPSSASSPPWLSLEARGKEAASCTMQKSTKGNTGKIITLNLLPQMCTEVSGYLQVIVYDEGNMYALRH